MNTQELKAVLLAEHKRDVKLMWTGYAVVAAGVLVVLGFVLWLILTLKISFTPIVGQLSGAPTYVKFVLPIAVLLSVLYPLWNYRKLQKRPETIEAFVKHIENGTRVVSINDSKIYRIKIPLFFVNYHTGAVQLFGVVLEGVSKAFILPVPFRYTDQVKDLLNENS